MTILNNTAVTMGTCTLSGATTQPFIGHGQIFWGASSGYLLTPLVQSRINTGGEAMPDELQRTIQLTGANVSLTLKAFSVDSGGTFTVNNTEMPVPGGEFSALFAASLPPNGSVNVAFEAIGPAQLRQVMSMTGQNPNGPAKIRAEVLATVTILGSLGGDDITSSPWSYPITVCNDCVVVDNGACPMNIDIARGGNACNPFQDGVVDCCSDASGNLICPGPIAQM